MNENGNKVFVVNKSSHDYSDAEQFGELHYLTEGRINLYDTSRILDSLWHTLKDSNKKNWLLQSGPTTVNVCAVAIMLELHGVVNLLIYKKGKYVPRNIYPKGLRT